MSSLKTLYGTFCVADCAILCCVCRGLEFLITTGPGPVPRLDGLNPVFGRVESGMDVVAKLAQVRPEGCRLLVCRRHSLLMCDCDVTEEHWQGKLWHANVVSMLLAVSLNPAPRHPFTRTRNDAIYFIGC
jgi:hypothetical protein